VYFTGNEEERNKNVLKKEKVVWRSENDIYILGQV
jgi:hypothetical protein